MAKIANFQSNDKFQTCKELLESEFPTLSQYIENRQLAGQLERMLPPVPEKEYSNWKANHLLLDLTQRNALSSALSNKAVLTMLDEILESPESYYNDLKEAQDVIIDSDYNYRPLFGMEKLRSLFFLSYEIQLKRQISQLQRKAGSVDHETE